MGICLVKERERERGGGYKKRYDNHNQMPVIESMRVKVFFSMLLWRALAKKSERDFLAKGRRGEIGKFSFKFIIDFFD